MVRARAFLEEFLHWAQDDSAPKKTFVKAPEFKPPGLPSLWRLMLEDNPHRRYEVTGPMGPDMLLMHLTD